MEVSPLFASSGTLGLGCRKSQYFVENIWLVYLGFGFSVRLLPDINAFAKLIPAENWWKPEALHPIETFSLPRFGHLN